MSDDTVELVGGSLDGKHVEHPGEGRDIVTGTLAFDPEQGMVLKHVDRYGNEQDGKLVIRPKD